MYQYIDKFSLKLQEFPLVVNGEIIHYCGETNELCDCAFHIRKAIEEERNNLMGFPNTLRIYDNPRYVDRYTVIYMNRPGSRKNYESLALPEPRIVATYPGFHLGKRIWLSDLSDDQRKIIFDTLEPADF